MRAVTFECATTRICSGESALASASSDLSSSCARRLRVSGRSVVSAGVDFWRRTLNTFSRSSLSSYPAHIRHSTTRAATLSHKSSLSPLPKPMAILWGPLPGVYVSRLCRLSRVLTSVIQNSPLGNHPHRQRHTHSKRHRAASASSPEHGS